MSGKLTRWRLLPLMLALLAVCGTVMPRLTRVAAAGGPSDATIPEMEGPAGTEPFQQSKPSGSKAAEVGIGVTGMTEGPWTFQVKTGGLKGDESVTFTFLWNGHVATDPAHSVSLTQLFGEPGGPMKMATPSVAREPGCSTSVTDQMKTQSTDVYAQTITLVMDQDYAPGTYVNYCFTPDTVAFPFTAAAKGAPGSGYEVRYTEPTGSVTAQYGVRPQNSTTATSSLVQIFDPSGKEVTGAGLAGTAPMVAGVTYKVVLTGGIPKPSPASSGFGSPQTGGYDLSLTTLPGSPDSDVFDFKGTSGNGAGCNPGGAASNASFCVDPNTHTGEGTLKVKGNAVEVVYLEAQDHYAVQPANLSLFTVGPPGTPVPQPAIPPPPPPLTDGKPDFDNQCNVAATAYAFNQGLGSLEIFDANNEILLPAFRAECPQLANALAYFGLNDQSAVNEVFEDSTTPFAFAGMDRALTSSEWTRYTGTGGINTRTVHQVPLFLEPLSVTYNLDDPTCGGKDQVLQLSSHTLSLIFSGVVTTWKQVATIEGGDATALQNCNLPILVAHDVGVASALFKSYLANRNPQWQAYTQPQLSNSWPGFSPVGCTANGSAAMAICVLGQPGMIGYGFYRHIHAAGLPTAQVDNASHSFFNGDPVAGCTSAATSATVPSTTNSYWESGFVVDDAQPSSGSDAPPYPICGFDFLTARQDPCAATDDGAPTQVTSIYGMLAYIGAVLTDYAQNRLAQHGYSRLPASIITMDKQALPDPSNPQKTLPTAFNC